jgi:hypothetical protein
MTLTMTKPLDEAGLVALLVVLFPFTVIRLASNHSLRLREMTAISKGRRRERERETKTTLLSTQVIEPHMSLLLE